jgi:Elongation factor Tu domain 2
MATRRKAKAKAKSKAPAKRKKTKVTKAATRRKTTAAKKAAPRKRPAKKAPVKRPSAKKAKPAVKVAVRATPPAPPPAAAPAPAAHAPPAPGEERVGVVTHYFSHLSVATVRLESGRLHLGDVIRIRGHTTDFTQRVESLEVNHAPTTDVGPNDDFGLKVVDHAREHDVVYKLH